MKKKILYIGNKLSKNSNNTPTGMESLGPRLNEIFNVVTISDKKNKFIRLLDFVYHIIIYNADWDIILIDTYSTLNFYYAVICSILSKLLNIPYVLILRGGNLEYRLKNSSMLSGYLFNNADSLISPSIFLKKKFNKYGFNVDVLPTPINDRFFDLKRKNKFGPKLLWVRKFHKIYNPEMAIKVVSNLKVDFPNIKLMMVGPEDDGSMENCKKLCIELGVTDNVLFTGLVQKENILEYYKQNDIFINTANIDNMPISVLEGLAASLMVVSTNVGGLKYILNDKNSFIINKNDIEKCSLVIRYILNNPDEVIQKIKVSYKSAEEYKWESIKDKWIDILKPIQRVPHL